MKNSSLAKIAEQLKQAERVLIFPHIIMDGDTLGSSMALYWALKNAGKDVAVLIEGNVPVYLEFIERGIGTRVSSVMKQPDLCIAIDCSDVGRLGKRSEKFFSVEKTISIDHHLTNDYFANDNYVDGKAAATGEIIYQLLQLLPAAIDPLIGEALYTAIATDTGNFQYTNTTKETHLIAAALFDSGFDLEKVSVELYQNVRPEKMLLNNDVMNTMEIFADGKASIACVTQEMLAKHHVSFEDAGGIIETLRNIKGVEIAAFLKEQEQQRIKVGFRAKTSADVAKIAQEFAGGGHKKAAGCTLFVSLEEAVRIIKKAVSDQLQ